MSNRDWLSLAEIARLWSEECGESADDLERDLDSWFTEFVAREPSQRPQRLVSPDRNPGRNGDNTNRLMGMLGGRHLERQTLEAYCEERGRPKPRFWFGGRVEAPQCEAPQCETPQRDATRPSKPAAGEPQAGSPQSGEKPPSVGPARDPDLESFQTQIADMSERLKAPGFEYSSLEQASADSQTDSASQSGDAAPSMDQYDRELIARADVASAKARELKMQLEAAEKRIANLAASAAPSHAASSLGPKETELAPPETPRHEARASVPFERPAAAGYRDPNAAIQLLQRGTRRGGRARTILLAGLAIPVAALVLWGGVTVIQLASDQPIPPPTLPSAAEQALPDIVSQAYEPPAERPGLGGEELSRPREPWSARETKPTTAELTAARLRLENALKKAAPAKSGAEDGPSRKELVLAIEIARAQAALYQQDLAAALERLAQSEAETQTANARTDILTKELIDTRRRHLAAVEIADADDNSTRRQLARDVLVASDRATSLERDLSAARRRISGLKTQLGAARTETASLAKQLAQLRKEHAALLEIFRAHSHQGSR